MTDTDTDPRVTAIRDNLDGLHPYGLARRAGVFDPDGPDTPGARFLGNVRDAVVEQLDYTDTDELTPDDVRDWPGQDWPHEAADSLVPVYTAERWRVFTDLGAWDVDVSDYATGDQGLTELAGIALYEVARTLIADLSELAAEVLEGMEAAGE